VYKELHSIKDILKRYGAFKLINSGNLNHPAVTLEYFTRFCYDNEIRCNILDDVEKMGLNKGDAFFLLRQKDLATLLRICKENSFEPGKDIGILAYNDSPLYEFIGPGISVISTDFELMGKNAAQFVIDRKHVQQVVPTKIKLRGSL
jgi:DNA-binding LacI/PurR family transcriptional regulator